MKEKLKKTVERITKPGELDHHQNTTELVRAIERKDKRFRFFQTVFMIGTFCFLIVIISSQQRTIDGINNQITEARADRTRQYNANEERTQTILRRLDCLAVYFSQNNRAGLTIENVDRCTLSREGDVQQFFTQDDDGRVEVTPNQQPSGSDSSNLPNSTLPNSGSGATTDPVDEENQTVEPRPPVTLELPLLPPVSLCVPITGICVR